MNKQDFLKTIKARSEFWGFFWEICQIPRSSGREGGVVEYLVDFAEKNELPYFRDENDNLIIYKDNGSEETIGLQAHMDMVCEKTQGSRHDFLLDPIALVVEGDFISAKDTTLGADNGIGIAYILAVLSMENKDFVNLECVFTVSEESDMSGVRGLDFSRISAGRMISFDAFCETDIIIGSASANGWIAEMPVEYMVDENVVATYEVFAEGFPGGHSGADIHDEARGNPIGEIVRILKGLGSGVRLNGARSNDDGQMNSIPTSFWAEISFVGDLGLLGKIGGDLKGLRDRFSGSEVGLRKIGVNNRVLDGRSYDKFLDFVANYRCGACREVNTNEISANLGFARLGEDSLELAFSMRANDEKCEAARLEEIERSMAKNGVVARKVVEIPAANQTFVNGFLEEVAEKYEEVFGVAPVVGRANICLEWSFFAQNIPDLEFLTIAPNIFDAHSVGERLSVGSGERIFGVLVGVLQNVGFVASFSDHKHLSGPKHLDGQKSSTRKLPVWNIL